MKYFVFLVNDIDIWIGLQNFQTLNLFDEKSLKQPLYIVNTSQPVLSDGTPYDVTKSFDIGIRKWKYDCLYLKARSRFKPSDTDNCNEAKGFVCKWMSKSLLFLAIHELINPLTH